MFSCAILTRLIVSCSDFLPSFCRSQSGPRPLSLNLSPNSIKIKHRLPVHLLWHLGHKPAGRQFYLLSALTQTQCDTPPPHWPLTWGLLKVWKVLLLFGAGTLGQVEWGHLAVVTSAGPWLITGRGWWGSEATWSSAGTCPGNWVTPLTATDHTTWQGQWAAAKLFMFTQEPQNVKMSLEGKINM